MVSSDSLKLKTVLDTKIIIYVLYLKRYHSLAQNMLLQNGREHNAPVLGEQTAKDQS